ncbi:glycosyltransferase family 2 protein [Microcella putealis]|uniref:glycosyltransferase family 2 protein n=1 Tax=Microcella putealis TaxID=337005 RepID=UPI00102B10C0|nr:glycosyltransferase family 2 protein [Microcella putealis]
MLLDIVMPFYGDERMFREAVESVMAQDDHRWRLTVIDDAYPDRAPGDWAASLTHSSIRFLRNSRNEGVANSFRKAVEIAEHDALCIMGCDDLLEPSFVRVALERLEANPAVAYVQPGVAVIDDDGREYRPLADRIKAALRPRGGRNIGGERVAARLLTGNWTYFPSVTWRTSLLKQRSFDARFEVVLDLDLQLALLADGGLIAVDDRATFRYRRHGGSVSSVTARDGARFAEEAQLFREWTTTFGSMGWRRAASAARWHLTSRLNAATLALNASSDTATRRVLVGHVFGKGSAT